MHCTRRYPLRKPRSSCKLMGEAARRKRLVESQPETIQRITGPLARPEQMLQELESEPYWAEPLLLIGEGALIRPPRNDISWPQRAYLPSYRAAMIDSPQLMRQLDAVTNDLDASADAWEAIRKASYAFDNAVMLYAWRTGKSIYSFANGALVTPPTGNWFDLTDLKAIDGCREWGVFLEIELPNLRETPDSLQNGIDDTWPALQAFAWFDAVEIAVGRDDETLHTDMVEALLFKVIRPSGPLSDAQLALFGALGNRIVLPLIPNTTLHEAIKVGDAAEALIHGRRYEGEDDSIRYQIAELLYEAVRTIGRSPDRIHNGRRQRPELSSTGELGRARIMVVGAGVMSTPEPIQPRGGRKLLDPAQDMTLAGTIQAVTEQQLDVPGHCLNRFRATWKDVFWQVIDRERTQGSVINWQKDWCYVPISIVDAVLADLNRTANKQWENIAPGIARLGQCLASWRLTKGIYRFDPTVAESLFNTPLDDTLCPDVLFKLPEWSIYIPTPGINYADMPVHGVFVCLEDYVTKTSRQTPELNICLIVDSRGKGAMEQMSAALKMAPDMLPVHLVMPLKKNASISQLIEDHLTDSIKAAGPAAAQMNELTEGLRQTREMIKLGAASAQDTAMLQEIEKLMSKGDPLKAMAQSSASVIKQILPLVLYICSKNADLAAPAVLPRSKAEIDRTGKNVHDANALSVWDVGMRIGAEIRRHEAASSDTGPGAGTNTMKPHIRRAHWHSFWKGPRNDPEKRQIDLQWLPPIPVNVSSADDTPATIRDLR